MKKNIRKIKNIDEKYKNLRMKNKLTNKKRLGHNSSTPPPPKKKKNIKNFLSHGVSSIESISKQILKYLTKVGSNTLPLGHRRSTPPPHTIKALRMGQKQSCVESMCLGNNLCV